MVFYGMIRMKIIKKDLTMPDKAFEKSIIQMIKKIAGRPDSCIKTDNENAFVPGNILGSVRLYSQNKLVCTIINDPEFPRIIFNSKNQYGLLLSKDSLDYVMGFLSEIYGIPKINEYEDIMDFLQQFDERQ